MILSAAIKYFEITRWTFVKVVKEECKIRPYDKASDCVGRPVKPYTRISFETDETLTRGEFGQNDLTLTGPDSFD